MHDRPDADADPALHPEAPPTKARWWHDRADQRPVARWFRRFGALDPWQRVAAGIDLVVVATAVVFILFQLAPSLLVANTTPAGGDMGAHVWGPAYLRDHLLPHFRLTGWTPDWYAGFPAYHFYMVLPALAIVALDAGWEGWMALVPLGVAALLVARAALARRPVRWTLVDVNVLGALLPLSVPDPEVEARNRRRRRLLVGAAIVIAVLGAGLPYGVAFKWVTVAGLLALPICCYAFGRLADLVFPGPALLAIGSLVFVFNKAPTLNGTGNIIGGNFSSTMAGEFSFSISLAFCVLYLGFLLRGLRTGRHGGLCAVLLALTALNHIIPAIYAVTATVVALLVSLPWTRARLRWFLPILPVGGLVTAFWTVPFYLRSAYLNDMGWEKLPQCAPGATNCASVLDYLAPTALLWIIVLSGAGVVVSLALRIRAGIFLVGCVVASSLGFLLAPQGRLWNARILPFHYLCLALLAAVGVAELARAIGSMASSYRGDRSITLVGLLTPPVAALGVLLYVGLHLGVLPGVTRVADDTGGFAYRWAVGPVSFEVANDDRYVVRDWARWNYSGYERKAAYPEYHDLVAMAARIGQDPTLGCGRVMWEFDDDRLDRYGTTMAPMLLPFWTDGCMGSMEGLYFEASSTTPYHFLNQRALSANCSCAQRDLPYGSSFDIDLGVTQLQRMGVRYYFAFSDTAVAAADAEPRLELVDETSVWKAYLVADSELVEPLEYEPVVLTGLEPGMSWVGPASRWWEDPARQDVALAEDGPASWQRVAVCDLSEQPAVAGVEKEVFDPEDPSWTRLDVCDQPERVRLPSTRVTAIETATDVISFDVTTPGVPVVVKASYFPNWRVTGAEGPYRLTPNLMVVIPTSTHVELTYGWTPVDIGAYALSGVGLAGVVLLGRRRRLPGRDVWLDGRDRWAVPPPPPGLADFEGDDFEGVEDEFLDALEVRSPAGADDGPPGEHGTASAAPGSSADDPGHGYRGAGGGLDLDAWVGAAPAPVSPEPDPPRAAPEPAAAPEPLDPPGPPDPRP